MSHWLPFQPTSAAPWNLSRVAHLHRRAVFGATWSELQRDLADDPQTAVTRILEGRTRESTPPDFDALAEVIGNAAADSPNVDRLKAWWLYRCLFSSDPLEERLTLMWHNHFATSNLKVDSLRTMKQQNDTLRQHARAPFGELLKAMAHDPALLVWLDAPANRKGHPNENLARELMELFSIGIGNYTETDVKEAARALTGWTVSNGKFHTRTNAHDAGSKTLLGQTGNWNGDDVVDILVAHPGTADRLAWRLGAEFFGEGVLSRAAHSELVEMLSSNNLNISATVSTILRSELFFSDANIGSRICDPISFLIGPLRAFECTEQPPGTLLLADWLRRMGQDLFYPPNVAGWDGGRAWLSTRTVIARANYGAALVAGKLHNPIRVPDLAALIHSQCESQQPADQIRFLARLLAVRCDDAAVEQISRNLKETQVQKRAAEMAVALIIRPEAHLH